MTASTVFAALGGAGTGVFVSFAGLLHPTVRKAIDTRLLRARRVAVTERAASAPRSEGAEPSARDVRTDDEGMGETRGE